MKNLYTVNSVRGDPLRKLLLIVSYHFVGKAKSQAIRDTYSTNAISGEPRVESISNRTTDSCSTPSITLKNIFFNFWLVSELQTDLTGLKSKIYSTHNISFFF
jgi:hypothetical protein